jgi:hypothetical protein
MSYEMGRRSTESGATWSLLERRCSLVRYVYVSFLVDGVKASIVEDTMSLSFLTFLLVLAPQRARLYIMIS